MNLYDEALLTATAKDNVLVQSQHFRTLPAVAARLACDEVGLQCLDVYLTLSEVRHLSNQSTAVGAIML